MRVNWAAVSRLLIGALFSAAACGHGPQTPAVGYPRTVLVRYLDAQRRGDHAAACALLAESERQPCDADSPAGRPADVDLDALRVAAASEAVRTEATVYYGNERQQRFVLGEEGWHLVGRRPEQAFGQDTPVQALTAFFRALEEKRYDVLLALMPEQWATQTTTQALKQAWEGEGSDALNARVAAIKAALPQPVHEQASRAVMPYDPKREVVFIKEEGRWRIADLE